MSVSGSTSLMRCLSDSHAHVQHVTRALGRLPESRPARAPVTPVEAGSPVLPALPALPRRLVLCGTHPAIDWLPIASLAEQTQSAHDLTLRRTTEVTSDQSSLTGETANTQLFVGFGVHPWFVESAEPVDLHKTDEPMDESDPTASSLCQCSSARPSPSSSVSPCMNLEASLTSLEAHLQRFPHAIVGEIGLDKLRGPPEPVQTRAFLAQMRLAARYRRPVSVHCVRHHGLLLQLLSDLPAEDTPPAIILHGFTGSLEVVKSLLKLKNKKWAEAESTAATTPAHRPPAPLKIKERLFFGVGASTSFRVKRFKEDTLPLLLKEGRALLETDAHYDYVHHDEEAQVVEAPEPALADLEEVCMAAKAVSPGACDAMEAAFDRAFGAIMPKPEEGASSRH